MPPVRRVELPGSGPEDVVVDELGRILTGIEDGRILRLTPGQNTIETVARIPGRPLGLEALPGGGVLVCNADGQLLEIDPERATVEVLVDRGGALGLSYCSNAVRATDGTIYFSESSRRFPLAHYRADFLEHSSTGRVMRRDAAGHVDVLLDGLDFANGLALSSDESFLVVAETGGYRLTRIWLRGANAGRSDTLVDNLPGFPDNLGRGSDGSILVAMFAPRDPLLDRLLARPGWIRKVVWATPQRLQPQVARTAWVLGVDERGKIVRDLQRSGDTYHAVTGVCEHGGTMYIASIEESAIGAVRLG